MPAITFAEKCLTTAQAAKVLRVTAATVKRYCNQRPQRLRGEKVGHSWMIPKSAIDEYLADESDIGRPKNRRRKTG
jgi:excisionase family DNA binding protein